MNKSEEIRYNMLRMQLLKVGINGLIPIDGKYIFEIETMNSNHLEIVTELTDSALTMTTMIQKNIDIENTTLMHMIGEFVNRVNINLLVGKFEFDYDSGNIWFYVSVPYCKVFPEIEIYRRLILLIGHMCDKYIPGMRGIINGITAPKEAHEKCENMVYSQVEKHITELLDILISECDEEDNGLDNSSLKEDDEINITFSKEFQDLIERLGYDI